MELMIVAGEASGDAHGAELVAELRRRHPEVRFFGCGGERMAEAGCELLVSAAELSVVGLFEVVTHLPRIYGKFRLLRRAMRERRPTGLILVDFPDFNMRLAGVAARLGVPVVYFISPQLWAWRSGRVKMIRRTVRRMICIFPFEPEFYARHGVEVASVGHPLVERVEKAKAGLPSAEAFRARLGLHESTELIALLPGSRKRELSYHLDTLIEAARRLRAERDVAFVLPVAPGLDAAGVEERIPAPLRDAIRVVSGSDGYAALAHARLALVASGTATVETALFGTPMVVFYRLSELSYRMGRRWVRTPHFAMVNLIAGKGVVPELIQEQFEAGAIVNWAQKLLEDGDTRRQMCRDLESVREKLGTPGAITRAASAVEEALALATP